MAEEVLMPKPGNTVETCIIVEWRKNDGDPVAVGDIICEVETDKTTVEIESDKAGTLLKKYYDEGDEVDVLTPYFVIGEAGEDVSSFGPVASAQESSAETDNSGSTETQASVSESVQETAVEMTAVNQDGVLRVSPRARMIAFEKGVNIAAVRGSGPDGRIMEKDVKAYLESSGRLSKNAGAAAASGDFVPGQSGSGLGGRVLTADLKKFSGISSGAGFAGSRKIPLKGIKKVVAKRMMESISSTCQLTNHSSAEAQNLLDFRKKLKASDDVVFQKITVNDLLLFAVAQTLPQFPYMNAHFKGDYIEEFGSVNLGVAVDTERGLLVPVIKNANSMSLTELSAEVKRVIGLCKEGKASADILTGGTFTVTNLGAMGVEHFTPILNIPEVAILGVGGVRTDVAPSSEGIKFVKKMNLSLTYDHQAVDGAPAARFMLALSEFIKEIESNSGILNV